MVGFKVISLTEKAAERVNEIVENSDGEAVGIRIGVKNGGCAGMEYTIEKASEPASGDHAVSAHGATVYVDPKAVLFLLGTQMDYETTKLRSGFVFNNPNQVSACGCGESVTLQEASPNLLKTPAQ